MRTWWMGWVMTLGVACASGPTEAPSAASASAEVAPPTPEAPSSADPTLVPTPPTPGEPETVSAPATAGTIAEASPQTAPTTAAPEAPPVRSPPHAPTITPRPPPRPGSPTSKARPVELGACETAADCMIHCASVPGCCPDDPCGCRTAIRKDARAAYDAWFGSTCVPQPNCPAMGCARDDAFGATCRDGRCVATDGPSF